MSHSRVKKLEYVDMLTFKKNFSAEDQAKNPFFCMYNAHTSKVFKLPTKNYCVVSPVRISIWDENLSKYLSQKDYSYKFFSEIAMLQTEMLNFVFDMNTGEVMYEYQEWLKFYDPSRENELRKKELHTIKDPMFVPISKENLQTEKIEEQKFPNLSLLATEPKSPLKNHGFLGQNSNHINAALASPNSGEGNEINLKIN